MSFDFAESLVSGFLLFMAWAFVSLTVRMILLENQIHRQATYFSYKGVVNGVAKENTWPIPLCLSDDTSASNNVYNIHESRGKLLALGVVMSLVACVCMIFKKLWAAARTPQYHELAIEAPPHVVEDDSQLSGAEDIAALKHEQGDATNTDNIS